MCTHIFRKGEGGVISAADGVGGSDDCTASLEGGDDAGFGNGDALLLHGFMDAGSVGVVHLEQARHSRDNNNSNEYYFDTLLLHGCWFCRRRSSGTGTALT